MDPAGNRDARYVMGQNVRNWYYLSPIPWDIILGTLFHIEPTSIAHCADLKHSESAKLSATIMIVTVILIRMLVLRRLHFRISVSLFPRLSGIPPPCQKDSHCTGSGSGSRTQLTLLTLLDDFRPF